MEGETEKGGVNVKVFRHPWTTIGSNRYFEYFKSAQFDHH